MSIHWQIGEKLQNRWEIYEIKHGGMGIVYIVYDHEWHEPFTAKTFREELFAKNPLIADRFLQEAQTWVNLDKHQNVTEARIVERIGGKPFLFLEYVSGGDLGSWIGTSRLTGNLPQVLRFAIQFCDGMIHALSKGIKAHRDIKPQNCLITHDNFLKVTDFGLAKVFESDDLQPSTENVTAVEGLRADLSQTGIAVGTLPYMAPEQFDDAKHLDRRADIYSFGIMLFQMITGRLPFLGQTWQDFEHLHKTQPPPPLPINNSQLAAIVDTCLAKNPSARFADFDIVKEQLISVYEELTGKVAPHPAVGKELDAASWNNKGWNLYNLGRYKEAISCYERALELRPDLEQAWNNKGIALGELGQVKAELQCYDQAIRLNPHYAEPWSNKGVVLDDAGKQNEALYCYDQALKCNPYYEKAWYNKARTLFDLGEMADALTHLDRALKLNPHDYLAWTMKGNTLKAINRFEEALACYDHALGINSRDELTWTNKGAVLRELGQVTEAISCHDCAIEINPDFGNAWFNKGAVLLRLGFIDEALKCYQEAQHLGIEQASKVISYIQNLRGK